MEYVCQLRNGYMLVRNGIEYRIKRTGYPYPDTPLPSQAMLDNLIDELGIKQTDTEYTISLLANTLEPYFGSSAILRESTLKEIIENSIGVVSDGSNDNYSVFFSCKFCSIYYVESINDSKVFQNFIRASNRYYLNTSASRSAFIIHFHDERNKPKLPVETPRDKVQEYTTFSMLFRERFKADIEKVEGYLNLLYSRRSELSIPEEKFKLTTDLEYAEHAYFMQSNDVCEFESNMRFAFQSIAQRLLEGINLEHLYRSASAGRGIIKDVVCSIYSYNTVQDTYSEPNQSSGFAFWMLSLYSCVYYFADDNVVRSTLKSRINELLKGIYQYIGLSSSRLNVEVKDGDVLLLTSPFVYKCFKDKSIEIRKSDMLCSFLNWVCLDGDESNKKLINSKEYGTVLAVNFGKILQGVSAYENKLFQYFLAERLLEVVGKDCYGCKEGHTDFSLRNAMKTILPNYDRLVMMGAIGSTDPRMIASIVYNFSAIGLYSKKKVLQILDNALDETTDFTDEEKSFIFGVSSLVAEVDNYKGDPYVLYRLITNIEHCDPKLRPNFRKGFVESLEPVFKMSALANICKSPYECNELLEKYTLDYEFNGSRFLVQFHKK